MVVDTERGLLFCTIFQIVIILLYYFKLNTGTMEQDCTLYEVVIEEYFHPVLFIQLLKTTFIDSTNDYFCAVSTPNKPMLYIFIQTIIEPQL